jgi:hypothetical protein
MHITLFSSKIRLCLIIDFPKTISLAAFTVECAICVACLGRFRGRLAQQCARQCARGMSLSRSTSPRAMSPLRSIFRGVSRSTLLGNLWLLDDCGKSAIKAVYVMRGMFWGCVPSWATFARTPLHQEKEVSEFTVTMSVCAFKSRDKGFVRRQASLSRVFP